ncbi:hypothetical protein [Desulfosporosinus sp.]|uniref:hypothetical protein n=1 Tax=Desulfosporosinus sp. TaxID=157907 RepID=UPI0023122AE2|nr:hypothetical protein [Desulfosporosinus sp.]MDA8222484.1 hypothetical protein [Desulfitobacterium hafniense]
MEQIINLDGLYSNLKKLIEDKSDINNIIVTLEKIHLEIIKRDLLGEKSQEHEKDHDIEIISKIGFYLLSVFLYLKPQSEDFNSYGMSVAGFCFELLSKSAIIDTEGQWEYNLFSSVCYSLSENQANAIVLAKQGFLKLNKHKDTDFIYLLFLKFLSREYKYILKYQIPKSSLSSKPIIDVLISFSRFMISGGNAEIILTNFSNLKHQLYNNNSQYFFTFALIYKVALEMRRCSIRNILQSEPELEPYLKVVTQVDTKNVYELWASQIFLMQVENQERSFLSNNTKNDISIISMPTSAGKTMISELAIFKSLIRDY